MLYYLQSDAFSAYQRTLQEIPLSSGALVWNIRWVFTWTFIWVPKGEMAVCTTLFLSSCVLTMCAYCALPVESWQCHPCPAAGTLEHREVKQLTLHRASREWWSWDLKPGRLSDSVGFQGSVFFAGEATQAAACPFYSSPCICFSFRFLSEVWFVVLFMAIDTKVSGTGESLACTHGGSA